MMGNEIEEACERARNRLELRAGDDADEIATRIADGIADLLTLARESGPGASEAVMQGAAHFAAAYMEPMEPEEVADWIEDEFFQWTGSRQFPEYIAERAIVLAGHAGEVDVPAWGI